MLPDSRMKLGFFEGFLDDSEDVQDYGLVGCGTLSDVEGVDL